MEATVVIEADSLVEAMQTSHSMIVNGGDPTIDYQTVDEDCEVEEEKSGKEKT